MTRVHAFADDALAQHDAVGLVAELRAGRVGIPELVEAAIARAELVGPQLNGLAHRDFDSARERAASPQGGFFAGIPSLLKDNVDLAGAPTAHGADAFVARAAAREGDFARMFLATGLIPLGKTRLSEFGFNAVAEHPRVGPVRGPWDTDRTAGASSSGSAALVAAGVVPLAHGNDGGGSIRIPASVNGLVGLKPTRDRLAQDVSLRAMPLRLVSDGVLTRSVRDTAAFYREAEKVFRNVKLAPIGDITRPARRRLKVAVVTTSVGHEASREVRDLTLKTAALLEGLGHEVEEAETPLPATFRDDFLLYWSMLALAVVSTGRRAYGPTWDASRLDNLTLGLARHSRRNLHRLPMAIARLRRSSRHTARFYESYDVMLSPTLAHETPYVGHLDPMADYDSILDRLETWVPFTPIQNATGDPAISLPLARTASGLPQGMMFSGPNGAEAALLELAFELEQAQPFVGIQDV